MLLLLLLLLLLLWLSFLVIAIITIAIFYICYHWNSNYCYSCHHTDMTSYQNSKCFFCFCWFTFVLPSKNIFLRDQNGNKTTHMFPDIWQKSNTCPIHKKGDKQTIINYRLVPLLPICGNIFERLVSSTLFFFLIL